jgi:hypothetical protein
LAQDVLYVGQLVRRESSKTLFLGHFFMPKVDSSPLTASSEDSTAAFSSTSGSQQVVEIGLLLPANWATALIELSRIRQTSVAQILRASVAQTLSEVGLPV